MNVGPYDFSELHELLELLCEERASSEQIARIQELARSSPAAMQFYVDYLDQHARLLWRFRRFATDSYTETSVSCPAPVDPTSDLSPQSGMLAPLPTTADPQSNVSHSVSLADADAGSGVVFTRAIESIVGRIVGSSQHNASKRRLSAVAIAACFGLVCFTLGALAFRLLPRSDNRDATIAQQPAPTVDRPDNDRSTSPLYAAKLVNLTSCRWDPTRSTADVNGGTVQPGQSLSLLEGVAEINTTLPRGGRGQFQLEGPLSMILTSEGMPSLQHGKLAAQVTSDFEHFTLDTPLGRAVLPHEASIGLVVAANEVELHVFRGEAIYESLWSPGVAGAADANRISAGNSVRISVGADGNFDIHRDKADESRFITHVSMTSNRLDISDRYVNEIRKSKPVTYWRFERNAGGLVLNEMSDRLHCRIEGNGVRWRNYRDNRSAEFGTTPDGGYLISDDNFERVLQNGYSIEAWIKPSHFHYGTVLSLIESSPQTPMIARHGMLAELCGPLAGPVNSNDPMSPFPGRFRFLHRNPPGMGGGHSCYSDATYALRKWQYLTSVKDGPEMRLYIDGKLVCTDNDPTPLPDGMRVLIGQLFPHDPQRMLATRPFVGELDEVAIYDRALSEKELNRHFQLARPASKAPLPESTSTY